MTGVRIQPYIVLYCTKYKRQDVIDTLEMLGAKPASNHDDSIIRSFNKLSDSEEQEFFEYLRFSKVQ